MRTHRCTSILAAITALVAGWGLSQGTVARGMESGHSGGDVDGDFIEGMVPHHQGAVDMARVELEKGTDERVRALAKSILDFQRDEIEEMTRIAEDRYGFSPDRSHSGPMGTLMGMRLTMDMSKMADMLAAEDDVDRAFLMMMLPHHAAAIPMAHEETRHGSDQELLAMAESITGSQAKEIGEMQELLADFG